MEIVPRLARPHRRTGSRTSCRCHEQPREHENNHTLSYAEIEECCFVSLRLDHRYDRLDSEHRPQPESHRRQSRGKAAPIGKPFERIANAGTVDSTSADPADRGADIQEE